MSMPAASPLPVSMILEVADVVLERDMVITAA
jgi:hypothetical protein